MTYYIAIVEEEEGKAFGVWFPDFPGCFSAGDTLDEAMLNAAEALGTLGQGDDRQRPINSRLPAASPISRQTPKSRSIWPDIW